MGHSRCPHRILVGKPEGKDHLQDLGVDARMILKFIFKKWESDRRVLSGSRQGQVGEGAVVNVVMNLRVLFNSGNFLTEELFVSQEGPCSDRVRVFMCFI